MTDSRLIKSRTVSDGFVELPHGIFTVDGTWYHTSLKDLEDFAPEILKKVGAPALFEKASDWARLPGTLVVWILPVLLWAMPWWGAALASFALFFMMASILPGLVLYGLIPLVRLLNHPFSQGFYYVAFLSYFAAQGGYAAVWTGLAIFVMMRWQVLNRFLDRRSALQSDGASVVDTSDRILRNVILSASLKFGASHPEVDRMEKRMIEIATRHKRKN